MLENESRFILWYFYLFYLDSTNSSAVFVLSFAFTLKSQLFLESNSFVGFNFPFNTTHLFVCSVICSCFYYFIITVWKTRAFPKLKSLMYLVHETLYPSYHILC